MDINQSKVSGNIKAIANLLAQGGVGDPAKAKMALEWELECIDINEYVALVHGDLGTGEQISSLLIRRAIEDSPW